MRSPRLRKLLQKEISEDGLFPLPVTLQNLTIQQVAPALGVTVETVRNLIEQGELAAFCISRGSRPERRHLRISRFSVLAFYYERLASEGVEVVFPQSGQIIQWRNLLRKVRGLPAITQASLTHPERPEGIQSSSEVGKRGCKPGPARCKPVAKAVKALGKASNV